MVRTINGLLPDDERATEALRGIKIGQTVAVEVTRPRNIQHHRLYWAMCTKIGNALDVAPENISDVLKLRTGHFVVVHTKTGPVHLPRSISFAAMDQAAFREFFERCAKVISMEWLPHMKADEIRAQIEQMVGIPVEKAA